MVQLVGSSSLGLGKLIDGKNQFIHIRYSAKPDGSNMTSEIQPDTKYIGIRTSSSETPSINPADYSWGRFVGTSGSSSYTWIRYSANEDGSNMTTIANEDTKYIGVAITDEDSAPTDHTRYSWALFKGSDGRGVERTEVSYQKSSSGTVIPTGAWSASIPLVNDGEYLWTRTLFFYTDGTTTSTFAVSRNGVAGLGIANTDVHYQKSTNGTVAPTGTWTVSIPHVMPNEYLWTRTTITYTDGSSTVSYSVGKMGADGRDAQLLYLTASSQVQAFDENDEPKTTEAVIISAKLQNASGAATFVAIPYIGNTAQPAITLGGTGNDRTLLPSQWTSTKWTSIAITATLGPLTDTISVVKVKDGRTPIVHTAWADSADGTVGFTLDKPVGKIPKYKGHYVDYSLEASTDPADYKWERNPDDAGNVADDANDKSDLANQLANAAKELADKAKADAAEANRLLGLANGEIDRLNTDVSNARSELERAEAELNSQIETVETKLTQDYATKTSLSETEITLNKKLSESVASVKQEMSETYAVKTDLTNLSGDYASFKEDTAKKFSQQVSSIETVQTDTETAKKLVNDALSKAQSAITNATNANNLANSALDKASGVADIANSASQTAADAIASANNAINSANAAKNNADKAIADVAALTKTVTTQGTKIDQTSSRIDLVANGVTEVGNKLDNLQVGGRNLLFKTGFFDGDQLSVVVGDGNKINLSKTIITDANSPSGKAYRINKYKKGTENVYGGCYWRMPKKLVAGKKYTWSVYVRGFGTVDAFGPEQGGGKAVKLTNTWTKVSHMFTANSNQYYQFTFYSNTEFDLYFTDLMLEEGNTPTPWSPAPEDQQAQIDSVNSNLQNNYYSKTQTDAAIKVASDNVTTTVRKETTEQITNINIGGINLLRKSAVSEENLQYFKTGYAVVSVATEGSLKYYKIRINDNTPNNGNGAHYLSNNGYYNLLKNKHYIFSYWIKVNVNRDFNFRSIGHYQVGNYRDNNITGDRLHVDTNRKYSVNKLVANTWTKVSIEFDMPCDGYFIPYFWYATSGMEICVYDMMLEEGNRPTAWSPAPDDMQNQITNINVGGTNLIRHSAIDVISNDEYDRWWYFTTDNTRYSSSFEQAEQYISIKTDISKSGTWGQWQMDNNVLKYTDLLKLNIGDEITIGADVWIDDNTSGGIVGLEFRVNPKTNYDSFFSINSSINPNTLKNKQWQRIYITGKITQKYIDCINDLQLARVLLIRNTATKNNEVRFRRIKVEMGNKPTPWSPSPGDLGTKDEVQQAQGTANSAQSTADDANSRVTVAESTIKQLSDSISMLVTDKNGSSMMTQTSNGWTFNMGAITSAIDNASNNINNLTGSLSQANNAINNLNNLANDLSKKTAYINMTTDETGAPCIELGKTGNAFKVRITNTSVDFIEGSSKIAYVSNQALFIEKAIIKNELQIGESKGFVWKTRSNGNLGLRWFTK